MWIQWRTGEENKSGNVGNSHVKIATEATLWILTNTHISLTHLVECKHYSFMSDCVDETNRLKGVQWTVWLGEICEAILGNFYLSFLFHKTVYVIAIYSQHNKEGIIGDLMPFVRTLRLVIWPRDTFDSRFFLFWLRSGFSVFLVSSNIKWFFMPFIFHLLVMRVQKARFLSFVFHFVKPKCINLVLVSLCAKMRKKRIPDLCRPNFIEGKEKEIKATEQIHKITLRKRPSASVYATQRNQIYCKKRNIPKSSEMLLSSPLGSLYQVSDGQSMKDKKWLFF